MSSIPKRSRGGPQTAGGKQASSRNSLVHGATSNNVVNADQKALVERYEHELTSYYKPESPLEKFQIQRIALCKVKLDALYELEMVKLQIAKAELEGNPKLALDRVHPCEDLTRSFAQTLSKGRQLSLPMNLTPELLDIFSEEIKSAGGKLDQDDNIHNKLPRLAEFIAEEAERLKLSSYEVILRIGSSIQELFDTKDKDHSNLLKLWRLGLEVMEARARGDEVLVIKASEKQSQGDVDIQKINDALSAITGLNSIVFRAQEVSKKFDRMQDLMLRSLTLDGEESDRLLRYQTTWERRLSSAIGELLALQAKNAR
jgi:hypothetical protein